MAANNNRELSSSTHQEIKQTPTKNEANKTRTNKQLTLEVNRSFKKQKQGHTG
eukprot:m.145989 g.145989  ORF g.145989 m.145989 type:complete len:53 (-) comp14146_c1_seq1:529-687(-)